MADVITRVAWPLLSTLPTYDGGIMGSSLATKSARIYISCEKASVVVFCAANLTNQNSAAMSSTANFHSKDALVPFRT